MEALLAGLRNAWPGPLPALGFAVLFAAAAAGFAGSSKLSKGAGLLAALGAVWCWLRFAPLPAELRGLNSATAASAAGVALLAGGWLFLAGRSAADWLTGFALLGLAACGLLFVVGAKYHAGIALLLHGGVWFLAARYSRTRADDAELPAGAAFARALAAPILAALLTAFLLLPNPEAPAGAGKPRAWRELAARPALPLAALGTLAFAALLARRLRPVPGRAEELDG